MERKLLAMFVGSLFLMSCHSDTEKVPSQEAIENISMREREHTPNMMDLKLDAQQERRTRGRVCPSYHKGKGCPNNPYYQDDYYPYYYEER